MPLSDKTQKLGQPVQLSLRAPYPTQAIVQRNLASAQRPGDDIEADSDALPQIIAHMLGMVGTNLHSRGYHSCRIEIFASP